MGWLLIARWIERHSGGREGVTVTGAPAHQLAAGGEIEIAGGKSDVRFLHVASRNRVGIRGGKADEAGGEGESSHIAQIERWFDSEDLVEDLRSGLPKPVVKKVASSMMARE